VQYLALRYTERLADAGVVASVGTKGDSFDNALAESCNGLYKAELIRHEGPWRGLEDVEFATLGYVDWFNHQRLHGELGLVPPAEFEAAYHAGAAELPLAASQESEPLRKPGRFTAPAWAVRSWYFVGPACGA
jgi:transposase InsO family protein